MLDIKEFIDLQSVGIARQRMIRESTDAAWIAQQLPIDWFAVSIRLAVLGFCALFWFVVIFGIASI